MCIRSVPIYQAEVQCVPHIRHSFTKRHFYPLSAEDVPQLSSASEMHFCSLMRWLTLCCGGGGGGRGAYCFMLWLAEWQIAPYSYTDTSEVPIIITLEIAWKRSELTSKAPISRLRSFELFVLGTSHGYVKLWGVKQIKNKKQPINWLLFRRNRPNCVMKMFSPSLLPSNKHFLFKPPGNNNI